MMMVVLIDWCGARDGSSVRASFLNKMDAFLLFCVTETSNFRISSHALLIYSLCLSDIVLLRSWLSSVQGV